MAALSEWLQLMLGEIARKRDDLEHARAEDARRAQESASSPPPNQKTTVTSVQEARAARR